MVGTRCSCGPGAKRPPRARTPPVQAAVTLRVRCRLDRKAEAEASLLRIAKEYRAYPAVFPDDSRQWLTSVAVSVPDERPHRQAVELLQRAAAPVWRPTRAGRAPVASAGTACRATAPRATRRSPALVRYTERGGRRVDRRPGAGRGFERPGGSFASGRINTVAHAGHRPRRSARTFIENEQAARCRS